MTTRRARFLEHVDLAALTQPFRGVDVNAAARTASARPLGSTAAHTSVVRPLPRYLTVDDCWMERTREPDGKMISRRDVFPSGIPALASRALMPSPRRSPCSDSSTAWLHPTSNPKPLNPSTPAPAPALKTRTPTSTNTRARHVPVAGSAAGARPGGSAPAPGFGVCTPAHRLRAPPASAPERWRGVVQPHVCRRVRCAAGVDLAPLSSAGSRPCPIGRRQTSPTTLGSSLEFTPTAG